MMFFHHFTRDVIQSNKMDLHPEQRLGRKERGNGEKNVISLSGRRSRIWSRPLKARLKVLWVGIEEAFHRTNSRRFGSYRSGSICGIQYRTITVSGEVRRNDWYTRRFAPNCMIDVVYIVVSAALLANEIVRTILRHIHIYSFSV